MTDAHHDELLRAALRAEADGVVADNELLHRIRAGARQASHQRWAPWLLAAAAAIVAGFGVVLIASGDDGPARVDAADDRTTTTTTSAQLDLRELLGGLVLCGSLPGTSVDVQVVVYLDADRRDLGDEVQQALGDELDHTLGRNLVFERLLDRYPDDPRVTSLTDWDVPDAFVASVPTPDDATALVAEISDLPGVYATDTTDCRDHTETPADGEPPSLVALVREDGWLITVDLTTGEQRELHFRGDPADDPQEGGPYYIDAVDLSPDGQWIWFSTCCEPASGNTYRMPVDGGEPELFAVGAYPRVSPDGRYVATGAGELVIVTSVDRSSPAVTFEVSCCANRFAWSPDGTQLAYVIGAGAEGDTPQVRLLDWDGASLSPADLGKPDNPGWFASWTPDGMPVISDGEPIADDRGLSQDRTYCCLLWIDEEGVVLAQAGHQSSDREPVPHLPEAIAADW